MLRVESPKRPAGLEDLIDSRLMARLDQLDVSSRKIFAGKLQGERRSKKRGQSVEFADHRPYAIGDDLRHIDWRMYARLDRLFLKLFLEEEDLSLHIVMDVSASMDCGNPSKFFYMQQVAAALGYVGLVNLNRVAMTAIGDVEGGVISRIADLRGRRRLQEIGRWICGLEPEGESQFTAGARRVALSRRGRGVMVLMSDFFHKEGYESALRLLSGHGYDVMALQVLSPQELNPDVTGDLRLRDTEDRDMADVTISAPLIKWYKKNLDAYNNQLRAFCAKRDITHLAITTDTPIDALLLEYLRRRGVLR